MSNASIQHATRRTLFPHPAKWDTQVLHFIAGVGTGWIAISMALFWWRPGALDATLRIADLAMILGLALVPVVVNFGLHEFAHHFVAEEYCDYPEGRVFFATTRGIILTNLTSIAFVAGLIAGEVFFGIEVGSILQNLLAPVVQVSEVTLRQIVLAAVSVSPGGVFIAGRSAIKNCTDETAVAGPVTNLGIGLLIWGVAFNSHLPVIHAGFGFWVNSLALTFYLAMLLSTFNALPLRFGRMSTDGYKVLKHGEPVTWALQVAAIVVPVLLLGGVL